MRVHHLNCMTFKLGFPAVTHCILVETEEGLVLVDSGMGTRDYTNPSRFMDWFMSLNKVPRDMEETAIRQVADLGYGPEDVRHIVLTHMHIDHTGGGFPSRIGFTAPLTGRTARTGRYIPWMGRSGSDLIARLC